MNKAVTAIGGVGLGAGMMYLLDPDRGRRRRAVMFDKAASLWCGGGDTAAKMARDFQNRATGLGARVKSLAPRGPVEDDVLVARVRARIGRAVSHPSAIEVTASQGRVTLRGPVLQQEVDRLLSDVASVRGARCIDNELDVYPNADTVHALQGGSPRTNARFSLLQANWTPAFRLIAGVAGAVLTGMGLRNRGVTGMATALAGLGVMTRATTNMEMKKLFGFGGSRAIHIQKSIIIWAPVEEVFRFWTNYQNFPRFMTHLREVRDFGGGRSYWVAESPTGISVSWEAELTECVPNQLLAWRSIPGSTVDNSGTVYFEPAPGGATRIQMRISYHPPAGALGHAVASFFGANPKREIDDDMARLKSLLEVGKTRAHGESVYIEDVEAGMCRS